MSAQVWDASATLYKWKAKYGGLEVSQATPAEEPRGREREAEAALADAMLDNADAEGDRDKKMVTPAARREAVAHLRTSSR